MGYPPNGLREDHPPRHLPKRILTLLLCFRSDTDARAPPEALRSSSPNSSEQKHERTSFHMRPNLLQYALEKRKRRKQIHQDPSRILYVQQDTSRQSKYTAERKLRVCPRYGGFIS